MPHDGQTGVIFESGGFRLLGTLFLAPDDTAKPTALVLHGIPGIEKNVDLAHMLRENGWNALIFHYRGCWGSEGDYVLRTIPDDVIAALDYLSSGVHRQIDPGKLILIGHSLGGWAALLAGAQDQRVKAVAAISAATDPPGLPHFNAVLAAAEFTPWLRGITPQAFEDQWRELDANFSPVEQVSKIAPRPLLVIHPQRDDIVPVAQAKALFARAAEPRTLHLHPEANHSLTWHRDWLRGQVLAWLNTVRKTL